MPSSTSHWGKIDDADPLLQEAGQVLRDAPESKALVSFHSQRRTLRRFSSLAVHDRLQVQLRERLSSGELERLVAEGAGLSDDEAVALSRITPNVVTG